MSEFVATQVSDANKFAATFPSLYDLCSKYKMAPVDAFHVLRRVLSVSTVVETPGLELEPEEAQEEGGEEEKKKMDEEGAEQKMDESEDGGEKVSDKDKEKAEKERASAAHKARMRCALAATNRALLPAEVWKAISPELYTTFWSLSMYDLQVPKEQYEAQIKKVGGQIKALETSEEFKDNKKKREKERTRLQGREGDQSRHQLVL